MEEILNLGPYNIFPDRVPPIPNTYEGWDAWSLGDLRNLIGATLLSPHLTDRAQGLGPYLDDAVMGLYAEPYNLDSVSRAMKRQMLEAVAATLPGNALEAIQAIENLYHAITQRPKGSLDIAKDAASRMPQVAADGVNAGLDMLKRGAEAIPPATPVVGGAILGAVAVLGLLAIGGSR